MPDNPTPGAPSPIPDPATAPEDTVLFKADVPWSMLVFAYATDLERSGVGIASNGGAGASDLVRLLLDRLRGAEARERGGIGALAKALTELSEARAENASLRARVAELEAWFPKARSGEMIFPGRWIIRVALDDEIPERCWRASRDHYLVDRVWAIKDGLAVTQGQPDYGVPEHRVLQVFGPEDPDEQRAIAEAARLNAAGGEAKEATTP